MGRRSINTTKSGKYMNPTDQARKEARKKELKKNKKQRQMVRAAVLKGKDPAQLIEEMEKIDEMEFNVYQPSPLNEKVLKEKRKKLKETLDRVMRLYQADDPELWADLKRKEVDYEKRRNKRIQYYESVRHAEQVQVDDIPLPSSTETPTPLSIPRIPMPPSALPPPGLAPPLRLIPPPKPLLKKPVENPVEPSEPVDDDDGIPGCPPGPPPDLFDMPELDYDLKNFHAETAKSVKFYDDADSKEHSEESDAGGEKQVKQPNTVQQKMLALSGQNIDDFMKEMESVQKKKEQSQAPQDAGPPLASIPTPSSTIVPPPLPNPAPAPDAIMPKFMPMPPTPIPMPGPPGPMQPLMIRPPPLRPPGMSGLPAGLRMPGRPGMPGGPPPGLPPRMGIRMPPGPPAGPPPKHIQQQRNMQLHQQQTQQQLLLQKDPKSATISAKPQIRNLSADVTRFVPSALRAKKDDVRKAKPPTRPVHDQHDPRAISADASAKPTKDDAYLQFMREMEDLL